MLTFTRFLLWTEDPLSWALRGEEKETGLRERGEDLMYFSLLNFMYTCVFDKLICTLYSNYVGSNCFMGDTFILSSCYAKKTQSQRRGDFDMINETKHVLIDIFILSVIFFLIINVGVRVSLRVSRLIPRTLKLTTM